MRIQYPKPTAVGQLQILNLNAMKTLAELLELVQEAMQQSEKERNTWFVRFAGHVNLLEIQYYPTGWSSEEKKRCHEIEVWLNREDEVQLGYWFLKKHL